jgi:hypothetical protein
MIMLVDAPETLLLNYQNLAAEVSVAEAQKDVLSQFLRARYINVPAIVELDASSDTNVQSTQPANGRSRKIVVKCLQCGKPDGDGVLDTSTVRFERFENNWSYKAAFRVASRSGKSELWSLQIIPDSTVWCVRAKNSISQSRLVEAGELESAECQKDKGYANKATFESENAASVALRSVLGFKLFRSVSAREFLSEELLAKPLAILGQETVKVIFGGASTLQIRATGKALSAGGKGQVIRVQLDTFSGFANRSGSKRIVDAVVVAPGEVSYAR